MAVLAPNGFELLKLPGTKQLTNLYTNSSLESNTTGYAAYGSGVTLSQDTAQAFYGTHALKVITDGASNPQGVNADKITAVLNDIFTASCWVFSTAGGEAINFTIEERTAADAAIASATKTFTLVAGWQFLAVHRLVTNGTAAFVRAQLRTTANHAYTFWMDGLQVEKQIPAPNIAYPSPYIDTNGGTASRTYPLGEVPRFMAGKVSPFGFDYVRQGGKVLVANTVANGDGETNATGWSQATTGGITVARSTADFLFGSASIAGTMGAGATNGSGVRYTHTPGGTLAQKKYYVFIWWKYTFGTGSKSSQSLNCKVTESGGASGAQTPVNITFFTAAPATPGWALLVMPFTPSQNDRTTFLFDITASNPLVNDILFIDGLQLIGDEVISNPSVGGIFPSRLFNTSSGTISNTYPLGQLPQGLVSSGAIQTVTPATINATSTLSGNVGALRRIVVGGITAQSALSGNVVALRRIIPSNITAASALSASTVVKRAILPSNILATSTLAGALVAKRAVITANIGATSIISSNLSKLIYVIPANITATSTVAAGITRLIYIVPGNIVATSTLNSAVGVLRTISPALINGVSTFTGALTVTKHLLPANIIVTSTLAGRVTQVILLTGNLNATSTISSTVRIRGPLITFRAEFATRNWYATTTKRNWSATCILPIRDWNVELYARR